MRFAGSRSVRALGVVAVLATTATACGAARIPAQWGRSGAAAMTEPDMGDITIDGRKHIKWELNTDMLDWSYTDYADKMIEPAIQCLPPHKQERARYRLLYGSINLMGSADRRAFKALVKKHGPEMLLTEKQVAAIRESQENRGDLP